MSSHGIYFIKSDVDTSVENAEPKDFALHSDYDTMKVHSSGEISLTVPEMTWWCPVNMPASPGANVFECGQWSDTYETKIAHNLGYVPLYSPPVYIRAGTMEFYGQGSDPDYDRDLVPTSTRDKFGNFLIRQCSVFGWGAFYLSVTSVFCDDTYIYLRYAYSVPTSYICIPGFETDPATVSESTISYYYTIFYNQADETLDL